MATADPEEDINRLTFNDVVPGLTQGPQITDAPLGLGKVHMHYHTSNQCRRNVHFAPQNF